MRILSAAVCLLLALSPSAFAVTRAVFANDPILQPNTAWWDEAARVRTGDFNNDGKADIAVFVSDQSTATLTVYRGQGDGTFAQPDVTQLSLGLRATGLDFAVGDLDADGKLDAALVFSNNGSPGLLVRYGLGNGAFTTGPTLWTQGTAIAIADMTGDGRLDLITSGLYVYPNTGGRTFGSAIYTSTSVGSGIVIGDANADGKKDVYLTKTSSGLSLLLGKGNGTFQTAVAITANGPATVADLDLNGRSDIIWADETTFDVGIRLALSNNTYPNRMSAGFIAEESGSFLTTADMDGDSRRDVLISSGGHVSIYLTQTSGALGTPKIYSAGSTAVSVDAADFDGDGLMDVVTGGQSDPYTGAVVTIMRGASGGTLRASQAQRISGVTAGVHFGGDLRGAGAYDATGDGKIDAVTFSVARRAIVVLPGNGSGAFGNAIETAVSYSFTPAPANVDAFFADLDGNGVKDVVLTEKSTRQLQVWLAQAGGTFTKSTELTAPAPFESWQILIGDFDGDHHLDLLPFSSSTLFFGAGDGTFTGVSIPWSYHVRTLVGDLNNDGKDDLLYGTTALLAGPGRTFISTQYAPYWDWNPSVLVDLNDDGNLDVVNTSADSYDMTVRIRLGNGDGTFQTWRDVIVDMRTKFPLWAGRPGDFDGDGNVDLAFHMTVLLGDGAGSFRGYARLQHADSPTANAVADFDGNGTSDLLLINGATHLVEIVRTSLTNSRELPMTVAITTAPPSAAAAQPIVVAATATKSTQFVSTGAVAFSFGTHLAALTEPLGGLADATITPRTVGPTSIVARFGGDETFASAQDSDSFEVTRSYTSFLHSFTPTHPTHTDAVVVRGSVNGALAEPPSGDVTITVDGILRATLQAPAFELDLGMLPPGAHPIALAYAGDSQYLPTQSSFSISVPKLAPSFTFSVSPASASVPAGTAVTMTLTVSEADMTGDVQFLLDTFPIATRTISGGSASFTTTLLPAGTQYLRATYMGNARYNSKSSGWTTMSVVGEVATSFHIISPCRILDTRDPAGPHGGPAMNGYGVRSAPVHNVCGIPATARAVAVNVTAVAPAMTGFLTLFPGAVIPQTSTTSYRIGRTRATFTIAPLSPAGALNVYNGGSTTQHVLLDVTGYFQ